MSFYQPAPQKKAVWLSIFSFLVAIGLLIGVVYYILDGSISTGARVEVISVYSAPEATAIQTLEDIGLEVEVMRATNIEIPKGLVYAQNPRPGARVNEGQRVVIFISEGGDRKPVPQVVGFENVDAQRILTSEEYGFLVEQELEDSPAIPGVVIRQEPEQGELLELGGTVKIFVSSGTLRVPDVREQPIEMAIVELGALGLTVVQEVQPHSRILSGFVINTRPGPGLPLDTSGTLVVIVSSGSTITGPLIVPDVVNLTEDDARLQLEAVGLIVDVTYRNVIGIETRGVVAAQDLQPGQEINFGDTISLTITRLIDGRDPTSNNN